MSDYRIEFLPITDKQFARIDCKIKERIFDKIELLAKNPQLSPNVKRLRGEVAFRLRVGDYRVVYTIDEAEMLIRIVAVSHRKDVYK